MIGLFLVCMAWAQSTEEAEPGVESRLEDLEQVVDDRGEELAELADRARRLAELVAEREGVDLSELALDGETGDNETDADVDAGGDLASIDVADTAED